MPHALAIAIANGLELIALHLLEKAIERCGTGKRAVADAQDLDLRLARIDRDERNALLAAVRQHIRATGKAYGRRPIAHINGNFRWLGQALADRRGEAGAELHFIALAVFETFDAELLAFDGHVLRFAPVDGDELLQVADGTRQALREIDTQTRLDGVGFRFIVDDAEAVLRTEGIEHAADLAVIREAEARRQSLDRRTPHGARLEGFAECGERLGALAIVSRRLERAIGGTRGIHGNGVALGGTRRVGCHAEKRLGETCPGRGVLGIHHDRRREVARGDAGITVFRKNLEAGFALLACGLLARLEGALEIALVTFGVLADDRVGEEGLRLLGDGRQADEKQEAEHEGDRAGEEHWA